MNVGMKMVHLFIIIDKNKLKLKILILKMECKAIINTGTQCSRIAETNSKYCWQHQNYDAKNSYFENIPLLQNTLLTYFKEEEPLKNINKQFSELNYEKYNTHIQPHGTEIVYFPGTRIIRAKKTYKNGKLNGLYEEWYFDGNLFIRCEYKDGKFNGLYQSWHPNGQLYRNYNYKNGELNDIQMEYYPNGKLELEANYRNGEADGLYREWYDDGQQFMKCWYNNGKLEGLYKLWWDNGQLKEESTYKNGDIKIYQVWNSDGSLKNKQYF
jgi:antitoxin component YwqK of YwqJK toxin-antitoxin module